ncbi:MAG: hypothetical protein JWN78_2015 [Bacteroidota bacterium]|nr:hypothetical protein [Bacteroidota bacterium]
MGQIYCIYTDKLIEDEKANPEHIIPLSLGGCDEFTIQVDAQKNADLGTAVDGKLANDFLISLIRRHHDFRGHSKKPVKPVIKKSKIGNKKDPDIPAQVTFSKERIEIFNPIEKRILTEDEIKGLTITSTFQFDRFLRICFTAKVILAAGYFIYGETFREYADHESLRKLMNLNLTETKESLRNLPIRIVDKFHPVQEKDKGMTGVYELICKMIGGSCVIFMLSTENIIGSVGIGGEFMGSVNFKADAAKFPNDGDFRLGHIVGVQNGQLLRSSFYDVNANIYKVIKE